MSSIVPSPAPLTPEREAEIRALADAATPGPWASDGAEIYQTFDGAISIDHWVGETLDIDDQERSSRDAAFIAAAREAVPALLAELDEARVWAGVLEQQAAAATEYRVPAPDGPALYVRRAPSGTGWAVFEPRGHRGRRAWTRDGWQVLAILTHPEAHCWPDATTALAEARKALGVGGGGSQ